MAAQANRVVAARTGAKGGSMIRREALKSLAALPFVKLQFKGHEVDAVKIAPRKYWVFVNPAVVDIVEMINTPWPYPGFDAEIWAVHPRDGHRVQDEIAIYPMHQDDLVESVAHREAGVAHAKISGSGRGRVYD